MMTHLQKCSQCRLQPWPDMVGLTGRELQDDSLIKISRGDIKRRSLPMHILYNRKYLKDQLILSTIFLLEYRITLFNSAEKIFFSINEKIDREENFFLGHLVVLTNKVYVILLGQMLVVFYRTQWKSFGIIMITYLIYYVRQADFV